MSSIEGTTISNSTIELTEDASASTLRNLNFYANCTSENPDYFTPIYINEADDLRIENNFIYIDYYNGCNYNLAGIYAFGGANNNIIRNNRISIYSKSENITDKKYIYGIDFSSYSNTYSKENARGNIISSNTIDIQSNYYLNGITLSCAVDTRVDSNNLILKSDSFAYGIVAEYFDSGFGLAQSNNFTFTKNTIEASSSMVYAIQFFGVRDVNISDNIIKSNSNASYGISGYGSYNHVLENNDIIINGKDISLVGTNFDAIGTGHSGIYYKENSHDILIKNNLILSNYTLGGDYAIKFDSSSTNNITVIYNNISSTALHGDDSVSCEDDVAVHDNNPYSKDSTAVQFTVFDIYVDANGDNSGNGSSDNPFLTLFKALNYLQALNADSGSNTKVKGIIHIGEGVYTGYGSNLRLVISNLNVELIGTGYNKTIIDGASSHWFFEISEESSVSIKNISFINGVYRQNNVGLIFNKGTLSLENCIFSNSKLPSSSAVVYNDGILSLKNNKFESNGNYYLIYNKGFIDNLFLNLIGDSLNENERILNVNSTKINLTAYVHDDNGNPIDGGFVTFFIEGREILTNVSLNDGIASLPTYTSLHGLVKISGFYSNAYTNLNVNIGIINNALITDSIILYVKSQVNLDESFEEDGTLEHPFTSLNRAFSEVDKSIEPITLYLLDSEYSENANFSLIKSKNQIIIQGNENKTRILTNWVINTSSPITLKDLIFDGYSILKINSDLTINNCLFKKAPLTAIYSFNGSLTLLNTNFTQNNVKDMHYPYYASSSAPDLLLLRPDWVSGADYEKGGAIYNTLSNLTILNCNFIENEAFNGGAIFNNQSDLHISNSNFFNNVAYSGFTQDFSSYSKGGAIFQYLGKEVVITDTLFINNTADGLGGAFFSSGIYPNGNQVDSEILGTSSIYKENESGFINTLGQVVENLISPQDIYFINCTFDSNLAPKGGGAVYTVNNSLTSYISCNFLNNMVFTYNLYELYEGYAHDIGGNWIYKDQFENVMSIVFSHANYGGAIHDNNLKIIDSTFTANTLESGGSVILPTVLTYVSERNSLSKNTAGITIANSVTGGESVYVADSSLLTSADSSYLGITGWVGTSNGSSIRKIIPNDSSSGSGSGDGNGNGNGDGNGNGNGNGDGTGTGNGMGSGTLSWGDILSALGGNPNNIAINGDGSGLAEYLNNLINGKSNSTNNDNNGSSTNSESNNNTNSNENAENIEDSRFESDGEIEIDDGESHSAVGESADPLSGDPSDSTESVESKSSPSDSSSSSPGASSSSPPSKSAKAYKITKDEIERNVVEKGADIFNLTIILILFLFLLILGYYRKSREDENR